ncbi:MAG TPA: GTP cyclohydrolase I, partial [Candidatus Bathyarchaeia archaeon]|nr:GTP cyclohydrolase I [Candidatus Bathyarchaeia archaeon]
MNKEKIKTAVRMILEEIDPLPERPDLAKTPDRVAKMYEEIFSGAFLKPEDALEVLLTEQHDEIVIVKDIPIYSMCEHHMLPFYGKAHVGYIPKNNRITGLSKLARLVDLLAKRLQVQERLTASIADLVM